jgi:type IV pilus assembly protein PilM
MPSSNVCWGIEVGAGAIKALKLEAVGEGAVRVADFVMLPHKKVLSTPDLDQNDALRVALGALTSQVDLSGTSIAVSVPGHSAFARFAKLPPVEPKKVPDIVKFEAVQQIPFPIDQVEWDYQTFASPDSPDVEVGIFAITRDRVMERLTLYEDVGMVPDYITLSPVAAYNAMAYDLQFTEKTPGTIILDIGTTSTDLVIAEAGRVWIRTFPIGGHHFTEALVNAFQLSYPKAEKLKREAESSKHARHIFQAMRPVFGDLSQDVQRSIGYYTSLHKDAKLERLIGLGSTFRLPGLRKYLKQQLQLDVYRMEQYKRLTVDGPKAGEFQAMTLNMGTAYGLALQGLGMATLEANLMPTTVIREAMWKRKVKWFGVAAGIACAAGAAMFVRPFLDSQDVANNPPSKVIADTIRDAGKLKTEAANLTQTSVSNTAASDVMGLLENREYFAYIVGDVRQMLAASQLAAATVPGFKPGTPAYVVESVDTHFIPPAAPAEGAAPDPAADKPRIQITMKVSTTVPDAQKFAISTIDGWLRQNAKRAGVPYELVIGTNPSRKTGERTTEAAATPGTPGGQPPIELGRGGDAGGGRGARPGAQVMGGQQETRGGGGDQPERSRQPDQRAQAALEILKRLAPTPAAPALEAGTRTTDFEVTWDAVIMPKEAKPDGGAS